jgi:hypothetical protein
MIETMKEKQVYVLNRTVLSMILKSKSNIVTCTRYILNINKTKNSTYYTKYNQAATKKPPQPVMFPKVLNLGKQLFPVII